MALCGVCGAEREPGTRFCRRCGTEFGPQVAGPQRPADTPWTTVEAPGPPVSGVPQLSGTGHGPGWYAVLAGAVAVLVVALVLGVMAFTGTGGDVDPAAGPATPSQIGPRTSPPPPPSTSTPPRTTRPAPTSSKPPSNPGNDLVAVSPVLAQHSLAPLVVEVATAYFLSINTRDSSPIDLCSPRRSRPTWISTSWRRASGRPMTTTSCWWTSKRRRTDESPRGWTSRAIRTLRTARTDKPVPTGTSRCSCKPRRAEPS